MKFRPNFKSRNFLTLFFDYLVVVFILAAVLYVILGFWRYGIWVALVLFLTGVGSLIYYLYGQKIELRDDYLIITRPFRTNWSVPLHQIIYLGYFKNIHKDTAYLPLGYTITLFYKTSLNPAQDQPGKFVVDTWSIEDMAKIYEMIKGYYPDINVTLYDRSFNGKEVVTI